MQESAMGAGGCGNPLARWREARMLAGVSPISIATLKEQAGEKPIAAAVLAQLQSRQIRTTKANKPYLELGLADATGHFSIKVWSDSPTYPDAEALADSEVIRLDGALRMAPR